MEGVAADQGSPEKGVGLFDLLESEARVWVHRSLEFGEGANDLGEEEAGLVEAAADDLGVDAFDVVELGGVVKSRDELRF